MTDNRTKHRRHGLWLAIRSGRFVNGHWQDTYRPYWDGPRWSDIIVPVVCRYMRRNNLDRVWQYNNLCLYLARDLSGNPQVVMRAIEIHDRPNVRLSIEVGRTIYAMPIHRFLPEQVKARHQRIIAARKYRLENQCEYCGTMRNVTWRPIKRFPKIAAFAGMNTRRFGYARLCMPCWNTRRGIEARAAQVAEIQSRINETKRKLKDACTF